MIDLEEIISRSVAEEKNGTNAFLKKGGGLSVLDLLYALMLPSGNDAALALAQNTGK